VQGQRWQPPPHRYMPQHSENMQEIETLLVGSQAFKLGENSLFCGRVCLQCRPSPSVERVLHVLNLSPFTPSGPLQHCMSKLNSIQKGWTDQ
jgi:hypothetical protein